LALREKGAQTEFSQLIDIRLLLNPSVIFQFSASRFQADEDQAVKKRLEEVNDCNTR